MNIRYVFVLAFLAGGAAYSAPLPNLSLSCPDENAINQVALDACYGYVYEIPTNERIVVSPSVSSYFWRKAADLAGSELVQVCTIPVEPGAYSSCRDAAGVRRTAFVRKDSVIRFGRNSVVVSKTGGDYTDPVTAAKNAFAGDTWCVAPQWPEQPCVMAIGTGIFILRETLSIPEGLAVSGRGKGDTMLVTDNGIETAVSSFGNVRISALTIMNSQVGLARTTGLHVFGLPSPPILAQVHDVEIHVSGASRNVAVTKRRPLEILESEITAVGQDTTGISVETSSDYRDQLTVERSHVSAETALSYSSSPGDVRLVDSHVIGTVFFNQEESLLDIVGSQIVGDLTAPNDYVRVVITGSSIKGNVQAGTTSASSARQLLVTDTSVEGDLTATAGGTPAFDGISINGRLRIQTDQASVRRSYIHSESTGPALSVTGSIDVNSELTNTYVEGTQALVAAGLEAVSSVLAGAVSGVTLRCIDTYGADHELLNASCQPQVP